MDECGLPTHVLTTGWLVCPTCEGTGDLQAADVTIPGMCPDCGGTGEPPTAPIEDGARAGE